MLEHRPVRGNIYGWLLLCPAAVLLIGLTYYPMGVTLVQSFYSVATRTRPAGFVGLENYALMLEDEVFWKVVTNNVWYAVGTIPLSIGIAVVMALWVNRRLPARGLIRTAYYYRGNPVGGSPAPGGFFVVSASVCAVFYASRNQVTGAVGGPDFRVSARRMIN